MQVKKGKTGKRTLALLLAFTLLLAVLPGSAFADMAPSATAVSAEATETPLPLASPSAEPAVADELPQPTAEPALTAELPQPTAEPALTAELPQPTPEPTLTAELPQPTAQATPDVATVQATLDALPDMAAGFVVTAENYVNFSKQLEQADAAVNNYAMAGGTQQLDMSRYNALANALNVYLSQQQIPEQVADAPAGADATGGAADVDAAQAALDALPDASAAEFAITNENYDAYKAQLEAANQAVADFFVAGGDKAQLNMTRFAALTAALQSYMQQMQDEVVDENGLSGQTVTLNPASDEVKGNYKPTEELTDADKPDEYQKNYQYSPDSTSERYLYKTAEWIDKDAGTARIKIYGKAPAKRPTSCVYFMEVCSAHQLTANTVCQNVAFLKQNFDRVDVVIDTPTNTWDGMFIYEDVQNITYQGDIDERGYEDGFFTVEDAQGTHANAVHFTTSQHSGAWMYGAMLKYFMGSPTSTTQQRYPSAVYVSIDYLALEENSYAEWCNAQGIPYNDSAWPILQDYQNKRQYWVMTTPNEPPIIYRAEVPTSQTDMQMYTRLMNDFYCVFNPLDWPGKDATTVGGYTVGVANDKYALYDGSDVVVSLPIPVKYFYEQSFEASGIPMTSEFDLIDYVSDTYVVTGASTSSGELSVDGQMYEVKFPHDADGNSTYEGQEVCLTLDVRIVDAMEDWADTNDRLLLLSVAPEGNMDMIESESPKLYSDTICLMVSKEAIDQQLVGMVDISGNMPDLTFNYQLQDANGFPVVGDYDIVRMAGNSVISSGKMTDGTFQLKNGESVVILGLSPGSYSVVETNPGAQWWAENAVSAPGAAVPEEAVYNLGLTADAIQLEVSKETSVNFRNHYEQLRTLTLEKQVKGADAPADATFNFTLKMVKKDGTPLQGPYNYTSSTGNGTVTLDENGECEISNIKADGTFTLQDVPVGIQYAFRETTVTAGGVTAPVTADWTTKWYVDPVPTQKPVTYIIYSVSNAKGVFTFPDDTYAAHDRVFYGDIGNNKTLQFNGTVVDYGVRLHGADSGLVLNPATDSPQLGVINIEINRYNSSTDTVILSTTARNYNLIGAYASTSAVMGLYFFVNVNELVYDSENSGEGTQLSGEVQYEGNVVLFENTYNSITSLTVTKEVEAENSSIVDPDKEFTFTVKPASGNLGAQTYTVSSITAEDTEKQTSTAGVFTLKAGETATFRGLAVGTYSVEESSAEADWTTQYIKGSPGASLGTTYTTGATAAGVALQDKKTTQVLFRNSYNPAQLVVEKSVLDAPNGVNDTFEFTLTKGGTPVADAIYTIEGSTKQLTTDANGHFYLKGGQTATIVNLTADTSANAYKVVETANENYVASTTGGDTNIPLANGASGNVTYTNTYNKASLAVSKTVTGTNPPADAAFDFEVTLTSADDVPLTGSYPYTLPNGTSGTLTLAAGKATVEKVRNGQSFTILELPSDAKFAITETQVTTGGKTAALDGKWSTTWQAGTAAVQTGASSSGDVSVKTVAYTNNYVGAATLEVDKKVEGEAPEDASFEFTLKKGGTALAGASYTIGGTAYETDGNGRFTLKADQKAVFADLAPDASNNAYSVEETENADCETANSLSGDSLNSGNIPIAANEKKSVTYTNTYTTTKDLTVKKEVFGDKAPEDATFTFDVLLKDAANSPLVGEYTYVKPDGTEDTLTFDATGKATVSGVAGGKSFTIKDLPEGATYTVTETGVQIGAAAATALSPSWTTQWAIGNSYLIGVKNAPEAIPGYTVIGKTVVPDYFADASGPSPVDMDDITDLRADAVVTTMLSIGDVWTQDTGSYVAATVNDTHGLTLTRGSLLFNEDHEETADSAYITANPLTDGTAVTGTVSDEPVRFVNIYQLSSLDFSFIKADEKGDPFTGTTQKAQFVLYAYDPDDSDAWKGDGVVPVAVQTSAADGTMGDYDGVATNDDTGKVTFMAVPDGDYVLVETKAPNGYSLPRGQWIVTVKDGEVTFGTIGAPPAFESIPAEGETPGYYRVRNFPGYTPPLTGGWGAIAIIVGGIVLLGTGVILAILTPKKKKKLTKAPPGNTTP